MILISKSALKESKEGTSVMVWNWYRRKMEAAFLLFICLGIFAACGTPQSEPQSAPCPTPAASDAPPDYSFAVPAEQCAVCGTCPQLAISALWGYIFEQWLPAGDWEYDPAGLDFEFYDERCHGSSGLVMDIYVPVKRRGT